MAHLPHNFHSEMIEEAGWRVNQPNRVAIVFEAEWGGRGDLPSDSKLIRNDGECPEQVVKAVRRHYKYLSECLNAGKHLDCYFSDLEKYADVWGRLTSLPEGVKLPSNSVTPKL